MASSDVRVLFVCLGNICRSPMAQGIFERMVAERGLEDRVRADSAATSHWHAGEPPDERAQRLLLRRGIDIGHQRGRQVDRDDFHRFDYIVAMDGANRRALEEWCPPELRRKLYQCTSFAPQLDISDVPDPFAGDDETFLYVYDIIEAGCLGLLEHIESAHFAAEPPES